MDFIKKITSRKFIICAAAFLGSVASSIAGFATDNKYVVCFGLVCGTLSAALYAACEAYVDGKSVQSSTTNIALNANVAKASEAKDVIDTLSNVDPNLVSVNYEGAKEDKEAEVAKE